MLDGAGNKISEFSFGGSSDDIMDVLEPTSGGCILGGFSQSGISGNKTTPNFGDWDYWLVKLGFDAPIIVTQPQSSVVTIGDTVAFSVVVDGSAPFAYQWLFNGNAIAGGTAPALTLTNTTYTNAGFYSVIVTNNIGSVTSAVAQLTFNFLTLKFYAGLAIYGQVGQSYRVEYMPSLGPTNWQTLSDVTLTSSPHLFIDPQSSVVPRRFYRAILLP
jgi:hypothetical protein